MKTSTKALLLASLLSSYTMADTSDNEAVINPDDLQDVTKINPQAAFFVTSDSDVRVSGIFSGKWNDNTNFSGFAEGIFGDKYGEDEFDTKYIGGRAQYFQAHGFDNSYIPRAGFSLDLVHKTQHGLDDTVLFSAGTVIAIDSRFTPGFQMFPNVAYTTGEVFGKSADGYLVNLFMTKPIGDNGAFMLAWPEYFDVSGSTVELESKSLNVIFQTPVKTNFGQWVVSKFSYNETNVTMPNGTKLKGDGELTLELGMKWYF
ncbi:hypothetical protein [Photobacterium lutimaris]|uniref:DUF481 domain-containing protein n=1 Tax=Photobacterium lutimaris TaxID=388278 RepID=A0A2T3J397_9GAMM|nr:hypothetical protein [Photobacterium lutimaris]PSU35777.1 hypothetical protein C9I99_01805 [Photobacterium lutimaris]